MAGTDYAVRTCTRCGQSFPETTEFFSPRREGRAKLASACKDCLATAARKKRATDPEARAKHVALVTRYQKRRKSEDPDFRRRVTERGNAAERRRRADPIAGEKERARDRNWYHADPERNRERNRKNRARSAAYQMRREAAKLQATPTWSETDRIKVLYAEARRQTEETGIKHNVDHIVPLRGRLVCGLHVFANLRIVTEFENKSKSNKFFEHLAV